jgi:hypothetical protein
MKKTIPILVIILVLAGLVYVVTRLSSQSPESTEMIPGYQNTMYMINGQPVTLVNGQSEQAAAPGSASKIVTRYFGNEALGDLNGDGREDVAFLITQEGGGSGTFFYIVASLVTDSGYQGTNAVFLGDRIAPQNTSIDHATILVNYADRKPDEAFTSPPSVGISKYFKVIDGVLVEANNR